MEAAVHGAQAHGMALSWKGWPLARATGCVACTLWVPGKCSSMHVVRWRCSELAAKVLPLAAGEHHPRCLFSVSFSLDVFMGA